MGKYNRTDEDSEAYIGGSKGNQLGKMALGILTGGGLGAGGLGAISAGAGLAGLDSLASGIEDYNPDKVKKIMSDAAAEAIRPEDKSKTSQGYQPGEFTKELQNAVGKQQMAKLIEALSKEPEKIKDDRGIPARIFDLIVRRKNPFNQDYSKDNAQLAEADRRSKIALLGQLAGMAGQGSQQEESRNAQQVAFNQKQELERQAHNDAVKMMELHGANQLAIQTFNQNFETKQQADRIAAEERMQGARIKSSEGMPQREEAAKMDTYVKRQKMAKELSADPLALSQVNSGVRAQMGADEPGRFRTIQMTDYDPLLKREITKTTRETTGSLPDPAQIQAAISEHKPGGVATGSMTNNQGMYDFGRSNDTFGNVPISFLSAPSTATQPQPVVNKPIIPSGMQNDFLNNISLFLKGEGTSPALPLNNVRIPANQPIEPTSTMNELQKIIMQSAIMKKLQQTAPGRALQNVNDYLINPKPLQ